MRRLLTTLLLFIPLAANAQPLFMKDSLGDREFFEPWGVGIDIYTMEQDYEITSLEFVLPGIPGIDTSEVDVTNELSHADIKLDAWVTPFMNVFVLAGYLNADTAVDLSNVPIPGLPFSLGVLNVDYSGTVYGGGVNFFYGGEKWFAALNNTWTDASLSGDFKSSVSSFTVQPRVGLIRGNWTWYAGAMYLDTEESHKGVIDLGLPGLEAVPFAVDLDTLEEWNYALGVGYVFGPEAHLSFEVGFGDREHTLFNFTYRF